jgi:RNA polymerase sigma-70 factor (ECF subfamily)
VLPAQGRDAERRAAFETVCLGFTSALYGTALRLTRRPEDASDVVQETFLRAYRTFDNFARGSNAKAWLFSILYSVFVNRHRKQKREPESVSMEDADERFLAARADRGPWPRGPEPLSGEDLEQALQDLPEGFRSALVMVDVEGLTYEEAAAALACPVGTLRSRLYRGRKLLFVRLYEHARRAGLVRGS